MKSSNHQVIKSSNHQIIIIIIIITIIIIIIQSSSGFRGKCTICSDKPMSGKLGDPKWTIMA
jgi:hypothetical protein